MAALLAAEIWMGSTGLRAWVPFAVLLPLTVFLLWRADDQGRGHRPRSSSCVDDARLAAGSVNRRRVPAGRRPQARRCSAWARHPLAFVFASCPWESARRRAGAAGTTRPTDPFWWSAPAPRSSWRPRCCGLGAELLRGCRVR
ncbi:hypothetical protein [Actinoplanes nipponensis]|uniref:hypothetical protein n=1 Tax=Actinoplanes nipponensis TaxID=135950 RepID=UPI0034DB1A3F